jgi:hypothetical protein
MGHDHLIDRRAFLGVAAVAGSATSPGLLAASADSESLTDGPVFNVLDYAPVGVVINTGAHDATSAWCAARDAAIAAGGGIVLAPSGTYLVDELTFDFDGLVVTGVGKGRTILKAKGEDQYVVRWALSKGRLSDLTIDGDNLVGTIGLGVVPVLEDGSGPVVHQNWNLVQNVEVRRCDDGFILRAGPDIDEADSGCWYNTFVACEAQDCLRGLWLRSPTNERGSPANRNAWYSLRVGNTGGGRANTGVQIDSGDTNDFFRLSCEGVQFDVAPNAEPTALKVARIDPLTQAENHYNRIFGFNCEGCRCDIHNDNPTLELHGAMVTRSRCSGEHPLGGLFIHGASESVSIFPPARIAPNAWAAAFLENAWSNYGADFQEAGYYRDLGDRVHLRGVLKGGLTAPSTVLFTLPPGFRPAAAEIFGIDSGGRHCSIEVRRNGEVRLVTLASETSLSLGNVSFRIS